MITSRVSAHNDTVAKLCAESWVYAKSDGNVRQWCNTQKCDLPFKHNTYTDFIYTNIIVMYNRAENYSGNISTIFILSVVQMPKIKKHT